MSDLELAIKRARESLKTEGSYAYLPEIIQTLEAIGNTNDRLKQNKLASGLGRLVTDDIEFLESPLGGLLSDLVTELSGKLK